MKPGFFSFPRWVLPPGAGVCAALAASAGAAVPERFVPHTFEGEAGGRLPYRLFVPAAGEPTGRKPLVVLLHGTSGRGTDNTRQFVGGNALGAAFFSSPENQAKHPCYVVVPQCPPDDQWVRTDYRPDRFDQPVETGRTMRALIALIDSLVAGRPIDPERVYVVGNSMGGYGAWDLVTRRPDRFAAFIPICGGGDVARVERLAATPGWIFHGEVDPIVDVGHSRRMVAALRQAGAAPQYTEYAGVGHDIAGRVYQEPGLAAWLFAQRRRDDP